MDTKGIAKAFLTALFVLNLNSSSAAVTPAERRAFAAAMQWFKGGWWELADRQLGEFISKYPTSELLPEALLRQAQARFRQRKFADAVALLRIHQDKAGQLADEWYFWLGEAQFATSNYLDAAEAYGFVTRNFPDSLRAPLAAYYEAISYAKVRDWTRVIQLLTSTSSPLRRAVEANLTNDLAINSTLLLTEAYIATGHLVLAEDQLVQLGQFNLEPCVDWRRLYLLGSLYLRGGKPQEALITATNLQTKAEICRQDGLKAESVLFKATVLEYTGKVEEALAEYESLLASQVPSGLRRAAFLRSIGLCLQQSRVEAATKLLRQYVDQYPQDTNSDAAMIALGELRLKQFAQAVANRSSTPELGETNSITNLLEQAMAQFDTVISNAPTSSFIGKAFLGKGWCLWLSGRIQESKGAFESAVKLLPFSDDRAVAQYKLADAQFAQGDFTNALANYQAVVTEYGAIEPVHSMLVEPALYQVVRTALALDDLSAVTNAIHMIIRDFPGSFRAQSVLLIAGQDIAGRGNPGLAREFFTEFEQHYPNSPFLTEVKLALARTFEQEKNWLAAVKIYNEWLTNYARADLLPQVEYRRGLAYYKAGFETNAFCIFTNLVTVFHTNLFAALAQNWVADFYFRHGDFKRAEENYQLLYQRWPGTELAFEARMMAGRAAVASLRFADAVAYFTNLINDADCPSNLVAQALFAYGDAIVRQEPAETNRPLANFEEAIRVFSKLQRLFPGTELATLAWGRIGDCYLQLASQDTNFFANALAAYQYVIADSHANISARSQAEVGLGLVLERYAEFLPELEQRMLRQRALEHFLRVVYQQNLRDGEQSDPFWIKEAGIRALRLAEELQMWEQLAKDGGLYDYMGKILPQFVDSLQVRKLKAKARLATPAP